VGSRVKRFRGARHGFLEREQADTLRADGVSLSQSVGFEVSVLGFGAGAFDGNNPLFSALGGMATGAVRGN
jgi:hypothetical protein